MKINQGIFDSLILYGIRQGNSFPTTAKTFITDYTCRNVNSIFSLSHFTITVTQRHLYLLSMY